MIYEVTSKDEYQYVVPFNATELFDIFIEQDPKCIPETWVPVRIKVVRKERGKNLAEADILVGLNSPRPIFNRAAVEALSDDLTSSGQLLPLQTPAGEVLFVHNTPVVDCVDYEKSEVRRLKSGFVISVRNPTFRRNAIQGVSIFVLPEGNIHLFVSKDVKDRIEESKLRGVEFRECTVLDN